MRVLLADDHALFLDSLKYLLTLIGIQVVGTARNGLEAYEKTLQPHPDIVYMDIRMPVYDGITATRLKLIGIEIEDNRLLVFSGSTSHEPTTTDLLRVINA